jgi:hypothetical protein
MTEKNRLLFKRISASVSERIVADISNGAARLPSALLIRIAAEMGYNAPHPRTFRAQLLGDDDRSRDEKAKRERQAEEARRLAEHRAGLEAERASAASELASINMATTTDYAAVLMARHAAAIFLLDALPVPADAPSADAEALLDARERKLEELIAPMRAWRDRLWQEMARIEREAGELEDAGVKVSEVGSPVGPAAKLWRELYDVRHALLDADECLSAAREVQSPRVRAPKSQGTRRRKEI